MQVEVVMMPTLVNEYGSIYGYTYWVKSKEEQDAVWRYVDSSYHSVWDQVDDVIVDPKMFETRGSFMLEVRE